MTINVTNVAEPNSAPVFTEGTSTTRSVAEDTASGQNIGAPVTATDADTSDTLTYTLGGTDAAAFGIVSASGQLQTSAALNYETQSSYEVTVFGLRRQRRRGQNRRDHQRHGGPGGAGGALQRDRRSGLDEQHELVEQRAPLGMAQGRNGRGTAASRLCVSSRMS